MAWNEELNILVPEQWNGVFLMDRLNSLGCYLLVSLVNCSSGMRTWNGTIGNTNSHNFIA